MTDDINQSIECSDCGAPLPNEWLNKESGQLCPNCGSIRKTVRLNIHENAVIEVHDSVTGKTKDSNYSSKRNPRHEFFEGDDLRKSDGKWMKKRRVIDKYNNKYLEKVVDPETGEIVHHNEESLTDHFNHGSAKPDDKDDT